MALLTPEQDDKGKKYVMFVIRRAATKKYFATICNPGGRLHNIGILVKKAANARLIIADMKEVTRLSIKIKISYERPEELQKVLHLLRPEVRSVRIPEGRKGRFKRAYVALLPDKLGSGGADRRKVKEN